MLYIEAENPKNQGFLMVPGFPDFRWKPTEEGGCPSVSLSIRGGALGGAPCFPLLRLDGELGGCGSGGFVRGGPDGGSGRISEETYVREVPAVSAIAT